MSFSRDEDEKKAASVFTRRAALVGGVQATIFGALGARLFNLQVLERGKYAPLAEDNRISLQVTAAKRGRVFDKAGRELAGNIERFRVSLTPALSADVRTSIAELRQIVTLSEEDVERVLVRIKKQSKSLPVIVASNLTFDQIARINVLLPQLPGVRTDVIWERTYSGGEAVGHLVGYVGQVQRVGIDDDAVLRLPEMRVGKTGVEAGFDEALRGVGGVQRLEVDARGRVVRDLDTRTPTVGRDARLTIDTDLQAQVLTRLKLERRAAVSVLDVITGDVVAMASTPAYDPADVVKANSSDAWQALTKNDDRPLLNRAIAGQYPPGSTFKMVTALAAMRAGLIKPGERINCSGRYQLAGQTFRCWKRSGHGRLAFHEALRSSCDVYFFELAGRLGINALAKAAHDLGFGETFDIGLPEMRSGLVPDSDWKRGRFNTSWYGGETILAGIGQGFVLATPLQLAVMTARLATGKIVIPRIGVVADQSEKAPVATALPFGDTELTLVRRAMWAVVNEDGGTGVRAKFESGAPVFAGKTGTSQVSRISSDTHHDSLPWEQRDHALFVGYAPYDKPKFAVAAVVEHGGGGGVTAAPMARDVLQLVLNATTATGGAGLQSREPNGSVVTKRRG
jgi:penicillin-binding protein 2